MAGFNGLPYYGFVVDDLEELLSSTAGLDIVRDIRGRVEDGPQGDGGIADGSEQLAHLVAAPVAQPGQ